MVYKLVSRTSYSPDEKWLPPPTDICKTKGRKFSSLLCATALTLFTHLQDKTIITLLRARQESLSTLIESQEGQVTITTLFLRKILTCLYFTRKAGGDKSQGKWESIK